MPQAVDCGIFLYAGDTCLLYQHKYLDQIDKERTENFCNICDCNIYCPLYLYDLCKSSGQDQINTRSSVLKLKHPSRSTCSGQNTLSYLTPTIWNNLPTCLKLSNSLNSFKHGVKEHFFKKLKTKNKIFLLIEVMHVASISISNCYLIFGNVSAGEGALDFPVVLELIQLLIGL